MDVKLQSDRSISRNQAVELLENGGPVMLVDARWRLVYINAAQERNLGVDRESYLGRPLAELFPTSSGPRNESWRQLERAMAERIEVDFESYYPPIDRWSQVHAAPTVDGGLAIYVTDITARRRREQELSLLGEAGNRLAESLDLEATLKNIGELVVPGLADWYGVDLLGPDGALRAVTAAHRDPAKLAYAEQLRRRYPPDPTADYGIYKVVRTGESELVPFVPDQLLAAAAQDAEHLRVLRELSMRSWMCVPLTARGQRIGVITLVAAESGRMYGADDLAFAENLAGRVALALDNARLYEEAQQAVRVRENVLAIVSHDLKSPLGAINLSAARLWEWTADHKARRLLENVQRAAARMNRLLLDLLDMARIGSGQFSVELGACPVAGLLKESAALLEPAADDRSRLLRVSIEVDETATVACDHNRLLQVLENLLSNAIKFCRPGDTIVLRAEPVPEGVRISVEDSGQGIPPEALPHLFDPYWSGQEHRKLGAGLGLYISQGIVQAHGGRIEVASEVGRGSTFAFTLPLVEKAISE